MQGKHSNPTKSTKEGGKCYFSSIGIAYQTLTEGFKYKPTQAE